MQTDVSVSVTRKRYATIDIHKASAPAWPDEMPTLSPQEAISAAKRLYRFGVGRAFKGKVVLTSGNRHTWTYRGELRVNPERGWKGLIHSLSHLSHRKINPGLAPHHPRHAHLEKRMIAYVIESGWLQGKLARPEKPKPKASEVRYQRTLRSIAAWEAKLKRAANALKKLRAREKYYERKAA